MELCMGQPGHKVKGQPTQSIRLSRIWVIFSDAFGGSPRWVTQSLPNLKPETCRDHCHRLLATLFSTIIAAPLSFLAQKMSWKKCPVEMHIFHNAIYFQYRKSGGYCCVGHSDSCLGGVGFFCGVIALSIHSAAALAKLFSEEIEHIDPGPLRRSRQLEVILFRLFAMGSFLRSSRLSWAILYCVGISTCVRQPWLALSPWWYWLFCYRNHSQGAYQEYAAALGRWRLSTLSLTRSATYERKYSSITKHEKSLDY